MKSLLRRLLNIGINPQLTYQETRTISFLNGLILLVLILILSNIPLPLMEVWQTPAGTLLVGIQIVHWIMIAFTLALTSFKKFKAAKIYFGVVAASFMTIYTLVMGIETHWSFFLPIIIFLQFYLFPTTQKRWMYIIICYCVICFIGLEWWFSDRGPLEDFPSSFILHFKYLNSFGFLFCATLMGLVGYNTINRAEKKLAAEHQRSENLLLNILPSPIAKRLKNNPGIIADAYDNVTILFADISDFTKLSVKISPGELIQLLNEIFSKFDELADRYQLEKIKTIGDAYMVVAGLPGKRIDHAESIAEMAMTMLSELTSFNNSEGHKLSLRIGICSGPVVAGVIGKRKFSYDLWGDSVNTASRMESHGIPGEIQVTESTYQLLASKYNFDCRGKIDVKGKGLMKTYLLKGRKDAKVAPNSPLHQPSEGVSRE